MSVGTAIGFCENSLEINVVKLPALLVSEGFFDLLMHRDFALLEDIARLQDEGTFRCVCPYLVVC